ncbi:MAG: TetR/AcrR family transcriptional regulator [Candidatus Binatia bacterium]
MDDGRRERLLDALEGIFFREGFRRVTVGELASRLRCSRRALYEIAPTKEDLFVFVLERLLRRIRARGEEAARSTPDLAERIEAYLAPGITETARATQFFSADVATFPPAHRRMEDHQRQRLKGLGEIVTEGARKGIFRGFDPHLVAEVFALAYRRAIEPEFLAETRLTLAEAFRELSQLLRHGLLHSEKARRNASSRRAASRRTRQP